ncbi:hypothetical protein EI42_00562 [Thermosporothrix hazakensis]|jgi:hypothetical protein|uniref:Uncharacterized protein n=2 Tax=Thermosporothrix TaxID=768650 RepID=A0A326UD40_THEHA|nr:hypothetical protein [Thermosporothrix hazakensis]PZW36388.1 hypothetical protein EI42_00562 [Thermosporothrix hazakensis]BBH88852.1 hypothetical protein KTC_36030 [Thermosporothrix sp. COM3]GCE47037.1 hypothetical protein KTH_19060 [Thermosporothrix hazakensis]
MDQPMQSEYGEYWDNLLKQERKLAIRDIIDSQLVTEDGLRIGRVASIECLLGDDTSPVLLHLLVGPEALASRISPRLRKWLHFFLHGRFEYKIPLSEVKRFGPTLLLHGPASHYGPGRSEQWIARTLFRWIPGSGYESSEN